MKLRLLTHTPKMLETMYAAANGCYSNRTPQDIFTNGPNISQKELVEIENMANYVSAGDPKAEMAAYANLLMQTKEKKMLGTVQGCIEREHSSVMTHGNFTFAVSGVSRVLTHQLMRHHTGVTFDQQSQRYVTFSQDNDWVFPESINNLLLHETSGLGQQLQDWLDDGKLIYKALTESDVHKEDARYILPNAAPTNFVMTINLTAFLHIWKLRAKHSTGTAQKEIADLMDLVYAEVIKAEPWLKQPLEKIAFEVEELKRAKTEINKKWRLNVNAKTSN